MGYNSPKEAKKLVGGIMRKRTLAVIVVLLVLFLYLPTIRNWATSYEAMVAEKTEDSLNYSTRKGALRHADYKLVTLCDAQGKEFERHVENAVYDKLKEGDFVVKKVMEDKFKVVDTVPQAEQIRSVCKIRLAPPKPEAKKKDEPPPPPPKAEKPIIPAAPAPEGAPPADKPADTPGESARP